MINTDKKVILLSGGMGGIGSAIAELSVAQGYSVAVIYRNSTEKEIAERREVFGENSFFVQCDVSSFDETRRAVQKVLEHFGTIDICIHAAVGHIIRKPILEMTKDEFRGEFEAGLFGAFNLFSSVAPHMKQRHEGMLIGITSSVAEAKGGGARMGAYSTAKFALRGLLRELHRELTPEGIHVYAVAPDLLKTPLTADLPEKYFEFAEAKANGRPLLTPLDVAKVVLTVCKGEVQNGSSVLVSTDEAAAL